MRLINAKRNHVYEIKAIHCTQEDLIQRLHSLGICEGTTLTLQHTSLQKHTFSVYVNGLQVALRKTEAELIELS